MTLLTPEQDKATGEAIKIIFGLAMVGIFSIFMTIVCLLWWLFRQLDML